MAHRTPNYAVVIVMMAVALAGSIAFAHRPEPSRARADVTAIARQAGDWKQLYEGSLDASVIAQLKADSFVDRWYVNPQGQQVQLLVVYRRYGRREFAHRPELCFPAAGYTISKKGTTTLTWAGSDVPAVHMTATAKNGANTNIAYFFASGKKTEENFIQQQLWMALERVIPNKNGWTFIRLQSPTVTTPEEATAAQQDFMRDFAPEIERIITTDAQTAS